MRAMILAAALVLAGCATSTEPVQLRYPDGRIVRCGPYSLRSDLAAAEAMREAQCINDHRAQGAVRI